MREIVHDDVRLDAVAFNQPFAFGPVDAVFGGGGDAFVHEPIVERKPDFAAPSAGSDYFAEAETFEAFGEGFAVGTGAFVAQHDDMAAEGVLHVPVGIASAALPIEPSLAHQLFE